MKHHRALGKVFEIDVEKMRDINRGKQYCQCEQYLKSIANDASFLWYRFVFCPCCFKYWVFGPCIRAFAICASVFSGKKDRAVKAVLSEVMKEVTVLPWEKTIGAAS